MMLKTQFSSKVDLSGFGTELFNYGCELNSALTFLLIVYEGSIQSALIQIQGWSSCSADHVRY